MNKKILEELDKEDESKQLKLFVIETEGVQLVAGEEWLEGFHNTLKEEFNKKYGKVSSNSDYTKMMKQKMIDSGKFKKVK